MLQPTISIEEVVDTLQKWACADPDALRKIFEARVPCNYHLAQTEIPKAALMDSAGSPSAHVSALDLLNALFGIGADSMGAIAMNFSKGGEEPRLAGFSLRDAARAELEEAVPVKVASDPIERAELQQTRERASAMALDSNCTCMPEWIDLCRAADRLDAMLARHEHEGEP